LSEFLHNPQLHMYMWSVIRLCAWLLILAVIFMPLEWLFAVRRHNISRRSVARDIGFYFISGLVPNLLLAVPLSVAAYIAYHFVPWRVHHVVAGWPLWLRGVSAFVIGEIGFYWGHRWAHEIPFLWRFHAIHHEPEHVYFLVSSRAHPVDFVFIRLCGLIPIYILGLGAPQSVQGTLVATVVMLVVTVWGFFIHANVRWRLGPMEWLISTPAFHHWHHTLPEPRDRNYASMLPCVDRLFGTYYLPRNQWPAAYGIQAKLPESIAGQLLYPLIPEPLPANTPQPAGANRQ